MKGFREFLFRGNLIDLAVAVVIGTAFTAVVTALVADVITPLIAAIAGKPNFSSLVFTVHHSRFLYGSFINALLSFVIIATVVYFLIVSPATRVIAMFARKKSATERTCPECLSQIPIAARRCMYCTSQVPPVTALSRLKAMSLDPERGLATPGPDACAAMTAEAAMTAGMEDCQRYLVKPCGDAWRRQSFRAVKVGTARPPYDPRQRTGPG